MPLCHPVFAICQAQQCSSTELVIYSCNVQQIVEIAFPICCGRHIVPSCILQYLKQCGAFWECFCGILSNEPWPVHFINFAVSSTNTVCMEVLCHSHVSLCGFQLNLNETHHTAMLLSSYDGIPPLATPGQNTVPDVNYLFRTFEHKYLGSLTSVYNGYRLIGPEVSFTLPQHQTNTSHCTHSSITPHTKDILLGNNSLRQCTPASTSNTTRHDTTEVADHESSRLHAHIHCEINDETCVIKLKLRGKKRGQQQWQRKDIENDGEIDDEGIGKEQEEMKTDLIYAAHV
ncbi:hypothetical protein F5J12DRAFT_787327 [Pisolithus orientalis]|uniref:uncharacterized protein n=1 Tax=Pisolithus orientalis TaxID=936130 RepID=UPI00222499BE|nr:uncharacterized protein F5J12DRAFT_787327 [Pisolithus orientalis]KAI5985827.1 hypothetical protein F5J12DRAFT_787327 [Pisolithus orientalis]